MKYEVRVIRDQIEARVQELARDRIDAIREDRRQHRRAREIMKARSGAAVP